MLPQEIKKVLYVPKSENEIDLSARKKDDEEEQKLPNPIEGLAGDSAYQNN